MLNFDTRFTSLTYFALQNLVLFKTNVDVLPLRMRIKEMSKRQAEM